LGKLIDITGKRFGFWLVLKLMVKNKNNQTMWLCCCDCGTKRGVTSNSLRTGNSTSCGCNKAPNLVNERFGKLLVIKLCHHGKNRRHWACQCNCGNLICLSTYQLREQKIFSCGCK